MTPQQHAFIAPRAITRTAGILVLAVLAGCGSEAGGDDTCTAPTEEDIVGAAVRVYVQSRQPTPLRFLSAVASDSAMPNAGMLVLQDMGPTYLYPPDSAARETVKNRLAESPWPSLVVTYHGMQHVAGSEDATVRLGGMWVAGELDGQHAGYEDVRFTCVDGGWVPEGGAADPEAEGDPST